MTALRVLRTFHETYHGSLQVCASSLSAPIGWCAKAAAEGGDVQQLSIVCQVLQGKSATFLISALQVVYHFFLPVFENWSGRIFKRRTKRWDGASNSFTTRFASRTNLGKTSLLLYPQRRLGLCSLNKNGHHQQHVQQGKQTLLAKQAAKSHKGSSKGTVLVNNLFSKYNTSFNSEKRFYRAGQI